MALLKQTQQQYYSTRRSFTGDGTTTRFTVSTSYDTFPPVSNIALTLDSLTVYKNGDLLPRETIDSSGSVTTNWEFDWTNVAPNKWYIDFAVGTTPADGDTINLEFDPSIWVNNLGVEEKIINYQFISLDDIISNFMISYTGENKIISKVKRTDV